MGKGRLEVALPTRQIPVFASVAAIVASAYGGPGGTDARTPTQEKDIVIQLVLGRSWAVVSYRPKGKCTFDDDDDDRVVHGYEDVVTHTVIRR